MHIRYIIIVLVLLTIIPSKSDAITNKKIENPYVEKQSHSNLIICGIEINKEDTRIYFKYKRNNNVDWINFSGNTYLVTTKGQDFRRYKVKESKGIPLSPNKHYFSMAENSVSFCLIFPNIDDNIDYINLYEDVEGGFKFYKIKLYSRIKEHNNQKKVFSPARRILKKDPNFRIE